MTPEAPHFEMDGNGHNPRWVIYPKSEEDEYSIIGPFLKGTAQLIANDIGGLVYKEMPNLKDGEEDGTNLILDDARAIQ